jgi:GAF domain-containing protein
MSFSSRTVDFFTKEYEEIARELGNQLTIVLHQEYLSESIARYAADLEDKVQQRTQQLQLANSELESMLAFEKAMKEHGKRYTHGVQTVGREKVRQMNN